jgi:hypothetical protein
VVAFTTSANSEPRGFLFVVAASIVMSSFWLYFIGLELVSMLTVISWIGKISDMGTGMIALGVCNSIATVIKAVTIVRNFLNLNFLFF